MDRYRRIPTTTDGAFPMPDKNSTKLEEYDGLTQFQELGGDVKEKFIKVAPQAEATPSALESLSQGQKSTVIVLVIAILFIFSALVAYARMNLGVHSIAQVIFGGIGGLAYSDIVYFQFFNSNLKDFSNIFYMNYANRYHKRYLVIKVLLGIPMLNLLSLVFYLFRLSDPPADKTLWLNNVDEPKKNPPPKCADFCASSCGINNQDLQQDNHYRWLEWKDYSDSLFLNIYYMTFLVILAGIKAPYQYNPDFFKKQSWLAVIARVVSVLVAAALGGSLFIITKMNSLWQGRTMDVVSRVVFCIVFPVFAILVFPAILTKHGILKRGELI